MNSSKKKGHRKRRKICGKLTKGRTTKEGLYKGQISIKKIREFEKS